MKIDYRTEVDSGFDRKRIVESTLTEMLKEGIPAEIVTETKYFNFNHLEMIRNIKKGYQTKEERVAELYHRYGLSPSENIVSDNYSGVAHPISGELYPMTKEECIEKFKKLKEYDSLLERLQVDEKKELEKDIKSLEHQIIIFEYNNPTLLNIIELRKDLDNFLENSSEPLSESKLLELLSKNGLSIEKMPQYEKIYKEYIQLTESLRSVKKQYEAALDNKTRSQKQRIVVQQKKELESEIVQRNIKLVNGFIRQKYAGLLVETEDLFQICCEGLWKAVQRYDYKKGTFATYAYWRMDSELHNNFKNLTGYDWSTYWLKESLRKMMNSVSNQLGRTARLEDLYFLGLLNIPYEKAKILMRDYYVASDVSITDEELEDLLTDQEFDYQLGENEPEDIPSIFERQPSDYIVEREPQEETDQRALDSDLKMHMWQFLDELKPREKKVLILRFGLDGQGERTLEAVGNELGVCKERVRYIEAKALRTIRRHPSSYKTVKEYLER